MGAGVEVKAGKIETARLVLGSIGSAPLTVGAAAAALEGKAAGDGAALDKAAEAVKSTAEAFVANNVAAPAAYRVRMAGVLAKRALGKALQRAV